MVRYRLLGPIGIEGGRPIGSAQQRLLLALLALDANRVVSSSRLVDELWGDDLPADPSAALRTQVSRLRRRLPPGALITEDGGYRLVSESDQVDAAAFERLLALGRVEEALSLWRGPAFAEFADRPAIQPEAVRLEALRIGALERRAEDLLERGDVDEASAIARSVLTEHPERELARAVLMRALYAVGCHREALAVYQAWCQELAEHGLEPSPPLAALESDILRHRVGARRPAYLPRPVSSFLGRDAEVATALTRLGAARLLTLCGPGGVGKSRLALEVSSKAGGRYRDGVQFCDLAKISRSGQVPRTVARAVGLTERAGRGLLDQLTDAFAPRQLLLVLDNCEHVLDGAAALAARLLSSTAAVDVLATSRHRLAIDGEHVMDVGPLHNEAAVKLFDERARAVDPAFLASGEDMARICTALDGLPLSIELAAARVRGLGVDGVRRGLEDRLALLTGGPRNHPRHRSFAAVIEWSYEHLDENERDAFNRLSVFAGRFDLDAAEAMGVSPGLLGRLIDWSLVEGPAPFRLLDTLRAYGTGRLAADGALASARARHALWVVELAEEAAEGLAGPQEPRWASAVSDHLDEMRAAHGWLMAHDWDLARRLAVSLHHWAFWRANSEVFRWAEVTAAAFPDPCVLASAAAGAWQRGDLDSAEAGARAALPHRRAREVLADVAFLRGQLGEARSLFEQAAAGADDAGDVLQLVWDRSSMVLASAYGGQPIHGTDEVVELAERCASVSARAMAHFVLGETSGDQAHLERAVTLAENVGARLIAGIAGASLAALSARDEQPEAALYRYGKVIAAWSQAGAWTPLWVTLRGVVVNLARLGAMRDAAVLYGATRNPRTGPAPFGADANLLHDTAARIQVALGNDFEACASAGAALNDDEVVAITLTAINGLVGPLGLEGDRPNGETNPANQLTVSGRDWPAR
jgi:predicted ATPase/DNA-binding SARP family transcriptional activator